MAQDGHEKQDCERAASKRWLQQYSARFSPQSITYWGDDLYANQPLCALIDPIHTLPSTKKLPCWKRLQGLRLIKCGLGTVAIMNSAAIVLPVGSRYVLAAMRFTSTGPGRRLAPLAGAHPPDGYLLFEHLPHELYPLATANVLRFAREAGVPIT